MRLIICSSNVDAEHLKLQNKKEQSKKNKFVASLTD